MCQQTVCAICGDGKLSIVVIIGVNGNAVGQRGKARRDCCTGHLLDHLGHFSFGERVESQLYEQPVATKIGAHTPERVRAR